MYHCHCTKHELRHSDMSVGCENQREWDGKTGCQFEIWKVESTGTNTGSTLQALLVLEQHVQENKLDVLSSLITEYLQLAITDQNRVNLIVRRLAAIFAPTTVSEQYTQKSMPLSSIYNQYYLSGCLHQGSGCRCTVPYNPALSALEN